MMDDLCASSCVLSDENSYCTLCRIRVRRMRVGVVWLATPTAATHLLWRHRHHGD